MFLIGTKAIRDNHLSRVMEFAQVMLSYHTDDSILHFQHVRLYTKLICLKYNDMYPQEAISKSNLEYIYEGARLHDIGKISVSDNILRKKGPLTKDEYDAVKLHTITGAQIIDRMADICKLGKERDILHNICLYHHERYDGNGYPEGLKGDAIPLYAQIVSIAEVYDALTEDNYKAPISHEDAIEIIISGECGVFNPKLISCLKIIENDLHVLQMNTSNENRVELLEGVYNQYHSHYWPVKRMLDIVFSGMAIVCLSPLMLCIAALIYIDDPKGSPIFEQVRLGRHKKPFVMYKFRTMVIDAEARKAKLQELNEKDGPAFKIANDPRITRVGKLLRKTGLDELPQLFNIIKGDMTIVGPRPPLPNEVEQYSRYQEIRLSVTPGLTCEWQVQPRRDEIGFNQWVDMDVSYIGTRSIWKDFIIVLRTIFSVFRKSGS